MHLYCVGINVDNDASNLIRQSIKETSGLFTQLDKTTYYQFQSGNGRFLFASIQMSPDVIAPKEYIYENSDGCLFYSGMPIDISGGVEAHKASSISASWKGELPQFEGQVESETHISLTQIMTGEVTDAI